MSRECDWGSEGVLVSRLRESAVKHKMRLHSHLRKSKLLACNTQARVTTSISYIVIFCNTVPTPRQYAHQSKLENTMYMLLSDEKHRGCPTCQDLQLKVGTRPRKPGPDRRVRQPAVSHSTAFAIPFNTYSNDPILTRA